MMVVALLCLAFAPLVVALTHGPGAATAAQDQLAHGHSHAEYDAQGPGAHDATDHEHQLSAVLPPAAVAIVWAAEPPPVIAGWSLSTQLPDGLRRPPRV